MASKDNNPGKRIPVQTVTPSPSVDASLPPSGDVLAANSVSASPSVDANLPSAGSVVSSAYLSPSPTIDANLPIAGDVSVAGIVRSESPSVDANLPQSGDESTVRGAVSFAPVDANLPSSGDESTVRSANAFSPVDANLPQSGDEATVRVEPARSGVDANIPQAGNTEAVRVTPPRQGIDADLPQAPDTHRAYTIPAPHELQTDLPQASDTVRVRVVPSLHAQVDTRGIAADFGDERDQRFQANFNGAWIPDWNGVNVGPTNYQIQENLRYRDDGLEGVDGTSRINAIGTGKHMTSGIQLRTNYTTGSYILAQGEDSDGTNRVIAKHSGTVPNEANFDALYTFSVILGTNDKLYFYSRWSGIDSATTSIMIPAGHWSGATLAGIIAAAMNLNGTLTQGTVLTFGCTYATGAFTITCTGGTISYVNTGSLAGSLIGYTADKPLATSITTDTAPVNDVPFYTESLTAQEGRFSKLPQGHVGFCDQKNNLIWAGDEMAVGACLSTTAAIVGSSLLSTIYANTSTDYTVHANNTLTDPANLIPFTVGRYYGSTGHSYTITKSDDVVTYTNTSSSTALNGLSAGMAVVITATNFNAANRGTFTVTEASGSYFKAMNASGVAESGKLLTGASEISTIQTMLLVGSPRNLSAVNVTVKTANDWTSTMSVYTSVNGVWTSCMASDGTVSGAATLSKSGSITITDVSPTPVLIQERMLYFYLFKPDFCDAKISGLTARADIQDVSDVWDGVYRTAVLCFVKRASDSVGNSFTLDVASESSATAPSGAEIGGLTTSEYMVVAFEERCAGFRIAMCADKANDPTTPSTMMVSYWNGTSWQRVAGLIDQTFATTSLAQNGVVTWADIPAEYERKGEWDGVKGYIYKLQWSAQLNNDPDQRDTVIIDTFRGIPVHRSSTNIYTFPAMYRSRAMWCGCVSDGQENRADYSAKNKPDVYNGMDASGTHNERSLYFGSQEPLTGFVELFNQFSDGLDSVGIALKATEAYILTGDNPEEFKIRTLSRSVGCPAPRTLDTAEVAVGKEGAAKQNVALWMDGSLGPVMCNGGTIQPIAGDMVRRYWTPGSAYAIPSLYLSKAAGIYDPNYNVYHLVIPSGSSATKNNVWLCYDLGRGKWFEIATGTDFPQSFLRVEDDNGKQYIYALTDSGYMLRLDYGRTWSDGTAITYTVKTGDAMFTGSPWDEVEVKRMKVLFESNAEGSITVNHYLNGDDTATGTTGITATPRLGYANAMSRTGGHSYRNLILQLAGRTGAGAQTAIRGLTHAFEFIVTGCTVTKPKLLGWGAQYIPVREDQHDLG